jgi:hypothetical protein
MGTMRLIETRRVWVSAHDNGWQARVTQLANGRFAAWASPDGTAPASPESYLQLETAKVGALAELFESGHQCSGKCTPWYEG